MKLSQIVQAASQFPPQLQKLLDPPRHDMNLTDNVFSEVEEEEGEDEEDDEDED